MKHTLIIELEGTENDLSHYLKSLYCDPNATVLFEGGSTLIDPTQPERITIQEAEDEPVPALVLNSRNEILRELSTNELRQLKKLTTATHLTRTSTDTPSAPHAFPKFGPQHAPIWATNHQQTSPSLPATPHPTTMPRFKSPLPFQQST